MEDALFYPGNLCYTETNSNFVRYHDGIPTDRHGALAATGVLWACRRSCENKKARLSARKEITLDLLPNHCNCRGLLHEVVGFNHLLNLCFLRICLLGSLVSTLDSLLFCSFIIARGAGIFKMGCSIRMTAKCWGNWEWTSGEDFDILIMLGGFQDGSRFLRWDGKTSQDVIYWQQ